MAGKAGLATTAYCNFASVESGKVNKGLIDPASEASQRDSFAKLFDSGKGKRKKDYDWNAPKPPYNSMVREEK